MTVAELMDLLDAHDPEATVRLAIQPNWPFQHDVAGVAAAAVGEEAEEVVYIAEGGQHYRAPYLPGEAAEALGWA